MLDVDDWFKFLLVNYSNGARRAQTVRSAEGPDIVTAIMCEIYPHYKDLYPCGVKGMTALYLTIRSCLKAHEQFKYDGLRDSLKDL